MSDASKLPKAYIVGQWSKIWRWPWLKATPIFQHQVVVAKDAIAPAPVVTTQQWIGALEFFYNLKVKIDHSRNQLSVRCNDCLEELTLDGQEIEPGSEKVAFIASRMKHREGCRNVHGIHEKGDL